MARTTDNGGAPVPADLPPRENPLLVGHNRAERILLESWNSGRMPHAWLIGGPPGIGKATLAYRVARFVLAQGDGAALLPPDRLDIDPDDFGTLIYDVMLVDVDGDRYIKWDVNLVLITQLVFTLDDLVWR